MAEVRFQKGSEEWQLFMDYWALCQKYWRPEGGGDYWKALKGDVDAFYDKYKTKFALELVVALCNAKEAEYNEAGRR